MLTFLKQTIPRLEFHNLENCQEKVLEISVIIHEKWISRYFLNNLLKIPKAPRTNVALVSTLITVFVV